MLRNLSESGALIDAESKLEEGQGVRIRISADAEEVRAEVVRRDPSGGYALQFTTPIAAPKPPHDQDEGPGKN